MASLDYAYRRLVNTLGPERVARSEFERMVYSHDFASLPKVALLTWKLYPDFVALPQTTEEVAALVKLSDESLLQLTPRGGGTGWYGGSVPNRGGVLVDMRKMNRVVAFDPDGRTVTVEAGMTWKGLDDVALVPYHATRASRDHFIFERALHPDSPDPADIALVAVQGSKDEVADQERTVDGLASKEAGAKLAPAVTDQLWRERYNNYSARRLSRGLLTSYNLVPVSRLPQAVETALEIRDKLKLNGAGQAFLVDSTTAALVPHVLLDDTRPAGV